MTKFADYNHALCCVCAPYLTSHESTCHIQSLPSITFSSSSQPTQIQNPIEEPHKIMFMQQSLCEEARRRLHHPIDASVGPGAHSRLNYILPVCLVRRARHGRRPHHPSLFFRDVDVRQQFPYIPRGPNTSKL